MTVARTAARYVGAGGTFLRTGGWAVLLDVAPAHPLVDRCWDLLGARSAPDEVLETVVAAALPEVSSLALVRETGATRVFAYGALALVLDTTDVVPDQHAGAWVNLPLVDVSTVEVALAGGTQDGPSLPLRDGVAAAGGFHLALGPGAAPDDPSADPPDDADTLERLRLTTRRPPVRASPSAEDTLPATFTTGLPPASGPRPDVRDGTGGEAPRVLAAVCPAGHLTPAYSGVCRVCERVVAAQEAFETTRPVLGRLVLPRGGSVLLDRGAVLGRAPHVPQDWAGPAPRLVALPDPDHDVSAQHLAVVLDLWNILVCDLGSTNGTALVDRGGRVTQLRPYEPAALRPGGSVVVADVITVAFEVQP